VARAPSRRRGIKPGLTGTDYDHDHIKPPIEVQPLPQMAFGPVIVPLRGPP
jgi:hypothetical protein